MRNFFGIFLLMFIFCSQLSAQKQLTLEDFFVDGTFRTKGVYGLRSMIKRVCLSLLYWI